jgi:RNA-binding protein
MDDFSLSGAQRAFLRGLGQRLEPALKLGREGLTSAVTAEIDRLLVAHELIKLRFVNADRDERAALITQIEAAGRCTNVGAVGHVALFFRRNRNPADHRIELPSAAS